MSFPNREGRRGISIFSVLEPRSRPTTAAATLGSNRVSSYSAVPSQHQQNMTNMNPPPYENSQHRRNFTDINAATRTNRVSTDPYRRNFTEQSSYSTQAIRGNQQSFAPPHENFTRDGHYATQVVNGRIKRKEVEKPGAFWAQVVHTTLAADVERGIVVGFVWDDIVAAAFGPNRMRPRT